MRKDWRLVLTITIFIFWQSMEILILFKVNYKVIIPLLLTWIGLKMENIFNPIVVLINFCFGT